MPALRGLSDTNSGGSAKGSVTLTDEDRQGALERDNNERGIISTIAGSAGFGIIDTVDVVSSSIGLTDRESINRSLLRTIDSPGLADYYNDVSGGAEVASAVYGIIGAELVTRKITAPGSIVMKGLQRLPYFRRLAALDKQHDSAIRAVAAADLSLAQRGAVGSAQYYGMVGTRLASRNAAGGFSFITTQKSRGQLVSTAKRYSFLRGATHAATTEAQLAIAMNQNGFLFDDDMSSNLMWMGLGVGLGGAFESAHTAYRIRKNANTDLMRRAFANALDPQQLEEGRVLWHNKPLVDPENAQSFMGGVISDKITSLMVNARTLRDADTTSVAESAQLKASQDRLATQQTDLAFAETQKLTAAGISTDGRTRFNMTASGYGNQLREMLYYDPAALNGVEQIGALPEGVTSFQLTQSRDTRLGQRRQEFEAIIESAQLPRSKVTPEQVESARAQLLRLDFEEKLVPIGIMDGERMSLSDLRAFEDFVEPSDIRLEGDVWRIFDENPETQISLDSSLIVYHPLGKTINDMTHQDAMSTYRLAQRAISKLKNTDELIQLPDKPDWFQLDLAEEIIEQSGGSAQIAWPKGMTRESAQLESLAQKAEAITARKKALQRDFDSGKISPETYEGMLSKLRLRYNLPKLTAFERALTNQSEHSLEALLRSADILGTMQGTKPLREMNLAEVKQAIAQHKRIGDMVGPNQADQSLRGNSFRFGMDSSGNPVKPMIAYVRDTGGKIDWSIDTVAERLAIHKQTMVAMATNEKSGPLTRALMGSIVQSPDFATASRTHELLETSIQGSIFGAAPQTTRASVRNAFKTSEQIGRDSPQLIAATRLRDTVDRISRDMMKATIEQAFGDSLQVLANPRNASTRLLLNQFHSFRSGWDLKTKPVKGPDGMTRFALASTQANKTRFAQQFGREMRDGELLLSPQGKEVVLDELAARVQESYSKAAVALVREKNTLLRAMGRQEIRVQPHYTAPPNLKNKLVAFTMGPDGKTVPGYAVVAETPEQFKTELAALQSRVDSEKGHGYIVRTQDDISAFSDLWDKVQMDFIDPGTTAIQPNKSARGASTGQQVNLNAFEESMEYLRDGFLNHGGDILQQLMKDSIQSAKMRSTISREASTNKPRIFGTADEPRRGVYDYYLENLLGKSKLNSRGSEFGPLANQIEGTLDKLLQEGTAGWRGLQGGIRALDIHLRHFQPGQTGDGATRDFNALRDRLGSHMPFESAQEYANARLKLKTPLTVEKITGELNKFSAAVILRMFEVAHPVMNLAGMVNAMPSVLRHMRQLNGESPEEWARRIGHSSQIFEVKGQAVAVPDMAKIAARGFKRAWSQKAEADYRYMVQRGYLSQEVAEFQRQFGAITSKGKWERFFLGDESTDSKGVLGWVSILSDKSEDFSRSWGHMVGLELADTLRISGREARHAFAHDIANKMIANYNPQNRPEVLQGALGAPIGLFQSFIINYYQRLFRYAETKDYSSLATQYVMQAGLFGVPGLTGFSEFQGLMEWATSGESDMDAGMYQRFGGQAGDLIAGGALSNLPKIFGLEAIDLYSRGDTNVRVPGLNQGSLDPNQIPAIGILNKIVEGVQTGLGLFSDNHPGITSAQVAEVASNMMANRPLAGLIEQVFANGYDTDQFGQVVADTQTHAEMVYRALGVRSMRQSIEIQAFYNDKGAQEYQDAARTTLRLATRSAIRDNRIDQLPAIFDKYLDQGGDPRYFRRWILENVEAAKSPRTQRRLEELLNNPAKWSRAMNMLDQGVGIAEDDALGDSPLED